MNEPSPGPWRVVLDERADGEGGHDPGYVVFAADSTWVCDAYGDPDGANARLIADAPKLLQLLREARNYVGVATPDANRRSRWEAAVERVLRRIDGSITTGANPS